MAEAFIHGNATRFQTLSRFPDLLINPSSKAVLDLYLSHRACTSDRKCVLSDLLLDKGQVKGQRDFIVIDYDPFDLSGPDHSVGLVCRHPFQ